MKRGIGVPLFVWLAVILLVGSPVWGQTIIRVSTTGNDAYDGSSWMLAKKTVQAGLNVAPSGGQVWVAAGTYVGCITLKDGAALYGGFAGNETDLSQRDWRSNQTILDGNKAGSVVTSPAGAMPATRIDGFTIRNGTGTLSDSLRYGGGIYCSYSSPAIANNTITANRAFSGSGIYCSYSSPAISNNSITGNSSGAGGGIYCYSSSPAVSNNSIIGNNGGSGGGIFCYSSSSPAVSNNIVAFNSAGLSNSGGAPTLRSNCVYNPGGTNYSGVSAGATDISVDPRVLAAEYGEVHLKVDSPCIDAGDDSVVETGWVDMDGQPRSQGEHVDIGADEFNGTTPPSTVRIVRVSLSGNDANDGSTWASAKRTVQAGIDGAAKAGGTEVWVAAGTYTERIVLKLWVHVYGGFAGTESSRGQRNCATNVTTLDGGAGGSVVTASYIGSASSTINGFTVRNGTGTPSGGQRHGGGIYCYFSSPTISDNTITGNSANTDGGGIYCESSSAAISNNTITGNSANYGGGIHCFLSSPAISNNTITDNSASGSWGNGGGVYCYYASPTISNNTITGNKASSGYSYGGGIYCHSSSPAIFNNAITANSAAGVYGYGGGIYCYSSSPTIANNTVVGNTARNNGGGIYCYSFSPPKGIANTIIAFNSSGIYLGGGTPTLKYNCVYGNEAYDYSGTSDPTGTNGNISADPLFVRNASPGRDGNWGTADDDYGDLRLRAGSSCIDAGDNAAGPADTADLDADGNTTEPLPFDLAGHVRFVNDPARADTGAGDAPIVDMGAYERMPGSLDADGDVDMDDFEHFRGCFNGPNQPYAQTGCQEADLDGDADVDLTDFGMFRSCFNGPNRPPAC